MDCWALTPERLGLLVLCRTDAHSYSNHCATSGLTPDLRVPRVVLVVLVVFVVLVVRVVQECGVAAGRVGSAERGGYA